MNFEIKRVFLITPFFLLDQNRHMTFLILFGIPVFLIFFARTSISEIHVRGANLGGEGKKDWMWDGVEG